MIDLRSDTVTHPTDEMRKAMANAVVGDDVYGDDPTVNQLEEMAAGICGKEKALFLPSGTMGNQVAIMSHTRRGDEIICGYRSHIFVHEVGGAAALSGVNVNTVNNHDDKIYKEDVLLKCHGDDIHLAPTSLLCLENPLATGRIVSLSHMKELYDTAKEKNLSVHTDGARLFNAAAALGVPASEICKYTDSVMFCLSKGLCAPVGSMLAGTSEFINRARKYRKMLGGGMRQSGILAAAGIIALTKMTERLTHDHENIRLIAKELSSLKEISILDNALDINMLFFTVLTPGFEIENFKAFMNDHGIKVNDIDEMTARGPRLRLVTHNYISKEDALIAANAIKEYFSN